MTTEIRFFLPWRERNRRYWIEVRTISNVLKSLWSHLKRFDIPPPPLTGGCSEGLDAFRFFFQQLYPDEHCGGYACQTFFFCFSFPSSANHEQNWPLCKVVFSGWQPIRWMWETLVEPIRCHEEVFSLQPMIPPNPFDIFCPWLGDAQKIEMR